MARLELLNHGLIPAVPVPFRGTTLDESALKRYAAWMATQPVAGVAVWAHTGRGVHLTAEQRHLVLEVWREALPDRIIVAGARDITMAIEARRGHADAILAFPEPESPVEHHRRLGRELPVIAFYLYQAAGGVSYDDATLDAILALPEVIGIKVATLDSVMTFQRIVSLLGDTPANSYHRRRPLPRLLPDAGSRNCSHWDGSALTDIQAALLKAHQAGELDRFHRLSQVCDRFAQATFTDPMEGYIRRMLWALAAEGIIPEYACDDPWGPPLAPQERELVYQAVRDAREASA